MSLLVIRMLMMSKILFGIEHFSIMFSPEVGEIEKQLWIYFKTRAYATTDSGRLGITVTAIELAKLFNRNRNVISKAIRKLHDQCWVEARTLKNNGGIRIEVYDVENYFELMSFADAREIGEYRVKEEHSVGSFKNRREAERERTRLQKLKRGFLDEKVDATNDGIDATNRGNDATNDGIDATNDGILESINNSIENSIDQSKEEEVDSSSLLQGLKNKNKGKQYSEENTVANSEVKDPKTSSARLSAHFKTRIKEGFPNAKIPHDYTNKVLKEWVNDDQWSLVECLQVVDWVFDNWKDFVKSYNITADCPHAKLIKGFSATIMKHVNGQKLKSKDSTPSSFRGDDTENQEIWNDENSGW